MPRRRPSHKAKSHSKPRPVDRKDSTLKRWNTFDDIDLDEEDQFHASRDKILLNDVVVEDEDGDEEEVFALRGMSDDSDDSADIVEEAQESDGMQVDSDADSDHDPVPSKSKSKPARGKKSTKSSKKDVDDSESEEETWGHGKGAYYSSNAAQLDSDDEEANELEEQEALRLQAKAREGMCDEDFGLGDVVEGDIEPPEAMMEELPKLPLPKPLQDKQTIIRTLEKESPETLALARDWDDTAHNLVEAKARVDALQMTESDTLELGLQHMYYQALLTYTTTLAFYLHLRATEKYAARPELLRQHPILNRLLSLKQGIHTLESLGVGQPLSDDDDDDDDDGEDEEAADLSEGSEADGDLWSPIKKKGLESGELADLLEDAAAFPPPRASKPNVTRTRPTEIDRAKKKRKPAAAHGTDPRFDLVEPDYVRAPPTKKIKSKQTVGTVDTDPYGEVTALGYHDLSDKQARKKSLRFYVSRIESSASRRTNARASAVGGDDDIPYKERRKEREARSEKERERKMRNGQLGNGGDDLDSVDLEVVVDKKRKRKRELEDDDAEEDGGDANGYYDLVRQASATKKARKKAAYETANARPEQEPESTSGPRSVTRAILKNKGLTPRRSKAVRNPRVKKRQKYDQAKKKVASQKAVYKGGIGDVSKYSGEQSGISKVVKSVRL